MGQFLNKIRAKLGLEPRRDVTLTGKTPNEIIISRVTQNESVDPSGPEDNPVVLAPMRMSPPTPSHGIVVNKAMEIAKAHGAPHHIILTRSHDVIKKKTGSGVRNPLTPEQKLKHAKRFFPDANIEMASQERPNLLSQAAELHQKGHKHLIVVAGSDRVSEYHNLLNKYNGQIGKHGYFNFPKISVVAAGAERDPDAEGSAGWSGTKSRQTAETGDFNTFRKKAVPSHINNKHAKELYDDLRSGMGVNNTVSEASEGYPVAAIPTRPIPTKDARDAKGKKSSLNNLRPPEDKGNIGLDSDLGDGKRNFNLLRRRALKRAVRVGFLEGYDDIDALKAPESNAPTTSKIVTTHIDGKRIKAMKAIKSEGTFTDVPGEQGSSNYGSAVNNSSDDTMIRKTKSPKNFKSVREDLRTDNPCWNGYQAVGTKKKGGKTVPNCVPKEEYGLDETAPSNWAVTQAARKADNALDKKYGYGTTKGGISPIAANRRKQGFGSQANYNSAQAALVAKARGGNVRTQSDAIHRGWGKTVKQMPAPNPEKQASREKLKKTPFHKLARDEQEKDVVVAKSLRERTELLAERGADSKGLYRSTESGAGLTRKGAKHFGIKTAVTTPPSKLDPNGKAAKRRKSFCARMGGMRGPMKDEKGRPTRKAMSLRRWHCEDIKYDDGDEGHTHKAGSFHRGDRVQIKKDGYSGKGNIDMYDPTSDSYVVSTDKHGSNLHLKASEIEAIKEAKARPYVKPHMENGKQVGYKSSDGYHVKYWRLADSALEKAKKHAKVDTVSENTLTDRVKAIMEGKK